MKSIQIAMICKLMPFYRLGVFQQLTGHSEKYEFSFFGDTSKQGGIKVIPESYASADQGKQIRWIKTRNYFYKPERLLWQTGILKQIVKPDFKLFVFEGAIAHLPIWLYAFLCQLNGKKVLFWTHGNKGLDRGYKKWLRVLLFKYLGDGLLLYGNTQREIMIADGYDPKRLFVIYNSLRPKVQIQLMNSLAPADISKRKSEIFSNSEHFTLIFIGRLVSKKQPIEIVLAVDQLRKEGLDLNCIFIGVGPEMERMKMVIKEKKIENQFHFAGELYAESAIAPYFAMADLLVSPGSVGLNCIHSLAYGVPVITHSDMRYQNPEVEAIVDGKTGAFFERNNFEDMSLEIVKWMENHADRTTVRDDCQQIINTIYNPQFQTQCIVNAIDKTLFDYA